MKVVIAILAGIGAIAIALCLAVGFTWYSDQVKSRMPNCGDVISTVEELSRESGKKKIVNASDQTLAITYINGALAQVGQQILNGECNPRNGQPCPGNGPFQSQRFQRRYRGSTTKGSGGSETSGDRYSSAQSAELF